MKTINEKEQKRIMLEMLKFLDDICRKNGIKYSLIGGSLIGAIRHHGYIPWDDDIDIILTKNNYTKLKKILDSETGRYQTLKYGEGGECFSFIKLIDTYTQAREGVHGKLYPKYGIYMDIFCYYPTSNNYNERKRQFSKIRILVSLFARRKIDVKNRTFIQNVERIGKNIVSRLMGYKRIKNTMEKTVNKYNGSKYVVSNWPVYSFEKEIQLQKNIKDYIDVIFEGTKVMIFKNYDEILRTSFGDYMTLPPKSERVSRHSLKMWWREGYEDGEKHR